MAMPPGVGVPTSASAQGFSCQDGVVRQHVKLMEQAHLSLRQVLLHLHACKIIKFLKSVTSGCKAHRFGVNVKRQELEDLFAAVSPSLAECSSGASAISSLLGIADDDCRCHQVVGELLYSSTVSRQRLDA
jgi:hypothetical protein